MRWHSVLFTYVVRLWFPNLTFKMTTVFVLVFEELILFDLKPHTLPARRDYCRYIERVVICDVGFPSILTQQTQIYDNTTPTVVESYDFFLHKTYIYVSYNIFIWISETFYFTKQNLSIKVLKRRFTNEKWI